MDDHRHRWRQLPTGQQAEEWLDAAELAVVDIRMRIASLLATARLAGKDFPSSVRRDGRSGGGDESATERLAAAFAPAELEADRQLAQDVMTTVISLVTLAEQTVNRRATPVAIAALAAGAGECAACGHWCTGAANRPGAEPDRIRSGYCDACYRAWLRAGRPDRARFEAERRARARVDEGERRAA